MTGAHVLQELEAIRDESDRILNLFENGQVPEIQIAQAQQLFRALKENLRGEYKRMSTTKDEPERSDFESRCYKTAIGDAWANSVINSVNWRSRPDNRWYNALWKVSDYMRYWSGALRSAQAGRE